MNKLNGMQWMIAAGLTATVLSCQSNEEIKKPNIIYILADDLGYSEIGCYGQTKIETPNIDALATQGMCFSQMYAGQAVSGPSRCVTLTGMHSGHAYIRGNDEMPERGPVWNHLEVLKDSTLEGQRPIPPTTVIIPKVLKQQGYATACIGKWGLGNPGSASTPNKMGFDFFYGYNCQREAHTYYPPFLYRNECREYLPNEILVPHTGLDKGADKYDEKSYAKYTKKVYSGDPMYEEMIKFVEEKKDEPFFLYWATPLPHVPLQAPERWVNYYREKFGDEEPFAPHLDYFPCRWPHATYAAMISYLDEQVGGLVAKLKELGIYDNTLIVFTSDNGPTFNGGSDSPWFESAKPFKSEYGWGKCFLREGGIRVPQIVTWPGKVKEGSNTDLICSAYDLMATVCDVVGAQAPKTDGISYLPTLLGKTQENKHEYLYWEFPEGPGQKAVRMGKWKAFISDIKAGNREIQLFDLETDIQEQHNVAEQHPEIVEKVLDIFHKEHEEPELKCFRMPEF